MLRGGKGFRSARLVLLGLASSVSVLLPSQASADLVPSADIGLGPNGYEVETADLDRDGRLELISGRGKWIDVRRGKEGEAFGRVRSYRVDDSTRRITVADLDRDGHRDIVTANFGGKTISILYGRRNGGFEKRRDIKVGRGPTGVAVARLNGDRRPDLAVTSTLNGSVSILTAKGPRNYERSKLKLERFSEPRAVVAIDLNNDGHRDLIHNSSEDLYVYLGRGDGKFREPQVTEIGRTLSRLASADLNGDGNIDLAVDSTEALPSQGVFILLGNGDGTFGEPEQYQFEYAPADVEFADITGDGIEDLVVSTAGRIGTGFSSGELWLSPGVGDGTFSEPTSYFYAGDGGPLAIGDFDESGTIDVAASLFGYTAEEPVARIYLNE